MYSTELRKASKLESLHPDFTHSPYYVIALFHGRDGLCSLRYEFGMNPIIMCGGMLWCMETPNTLKYFYQRAESILRRKGLSRTPLRPDIAILPTYFN